MKRRAIFRIKHTDFNGEVSWFPKEFIIIRETNSMYKIRSAYRFFGYSWIGKERCLEEIK